MGTEEFLSSQPSSVIIVPLRKSFNLRLFERRIVPAISVRYVTLGGREIMYACDLWLTFLSAVFLSAAFPSANPAEKQRTKQLIDTDYGHCISPSLILNYCIIPYTPDLRSAQVHIFKTD